jgi:hypothetical protein
MSCCVHAEVLYISNTAVCKYIIFAVCSVLSQ